MKNEDIIQEIGILGGGGQADEIESFLDAGVRVQFRALDCEYLDTRNPVHIDIANPTKQQQQLPVIPAIGAPLIRKKLVTVWSGSNYEAIVHRSAVVDTSAAIGEGVVVAPGSIVTTGVSIGSYSIINVGATISHNCSLGEYATIGPGVHLGGNVTLGEGVFIGIGAVVKNGVAIASGVVIGAGAAVLHDITEENAVYAGVPARKIGQNDSWLSGVR